MILEGTLFRRVMEFKEKSEAELGSETVSAVVRKLIVAGLNADERKGSQ